MIDLRFKKIPCREESGQELLPVKSCGDERTRHPQTRGRRDGARLVRADHRGDRADARRGPELRDVGSRAVLDSMLTITLWQQHGNYLLSLGFAVGGVFLSVVLLAQGGWAWGKFETVIALMVLASLAVWKFSGPRNATIAVTTAICIAGIPGIVEMLRKPQRSAGKL